MCFTLPSKLLSELQCVLLLRIGVFVEKHVQLETRAGAVRLCGTRQANTEPHKKRVLSQKPRCTVWVREPQ